MNRRDRRKFKKKFPDANQCAFCNRSSTDVGWFRVGEDRCDIEDAIMEGAATEGMPSEARMAALERWEAGQGKAWVIHVHQCPRHFHIHMCPVHWDAMERSAWRDEGWAPAHVAEFFSHHG